MNEPGHTFPTDWQHGFPGELWVSEIVEHLDPVDVIALGRTCRLLRSMVHRRSVWSRIVRSVCTRNHLFVPSYPIDDMELSHLQRAATLPHLWNRLFEKEGVRPMELKDARPLPIATLGPQWHGHGVNAYLAPGGRFCFTFLNTGADTVVINVWDLGAPGRSPLVDPLLVTSRTEQNGPNRDLANVWVSLWANEGETIGLAVSQNATIATGGDCTTIRVFNISVREGAASFIESTTPLIVTNGLDRRPWGVILRAHYVLICLPMGTAYVLWNTQTDRCTIWATGGQGSFVTTSIFNGEEVVLLNKDTISVWNVAALEAQSEPRPPGILDPMSAELIPSSVTIPSPWANTNARRLWFTAQSPQYIGASATFDVFMTPNHAADERKIKETLCGRYAVAYQGASDGSSPATHPTYSLETLSTWSFPSGSFEPHMHFYHCASMDVPRLTADSHGRVRTILYIPSRSADTQSIDRQEDSEHGKVTVKILAVESHPIITSCPASGRFVYYKWDKEAHRPTLYLVDYLA